MACIYYYFEKAIAWTLKMFETLWLKSKCISFHLSDSSDKLWAYMQSRTSRGPQGLVCQLNNYDWTASAPARDVLNIKFNELQVASFPRTLRHGPYGLFIIPCTIREFLSLSCARCQCLKIIVSILGTYLYIHTEIYTNNCIHSNELTALNI